MERSIPCLKDVIEKFLLLFFGKDTYVVDIFMSEVPYFPKFLLYRNVLLSKFSHYEFYKIRIRVCLYRFDRSIVSH